MPSKPRVYSYIRFSSSEQAMGDSERRQLEEARSWVKKNSLELDESLGELTDRGLSGFHGHHRTKGKLGLFLSTVKAGKVPAGSILLVENVDRLGREDPLQALPNVTNIVNEGITIQTLSPLESYTRDSINDGKIWQLVGQIQRAHEESKRKSELAKANWSRKRVLAREQKQVLTGYTPAWLKVKDGKFEVIKEAAAKTRAALPSGMAAREENVNRKCPCRIDATRPD